MDRLGIPGFTRRLKALPAFRSECARLVAEINHWKLYVPTLWFSYAQDWLAMGPAGEEKRRGSVFEGFELRHRLWLMVLASCQQLNIPC